LSIAWCVIDGAFQGVDYTLGRPPDQRDRKRPCRPRAFGEELSRVFGDGAIRNQARTAAPRCMITDRGRKFNPSGHGVPSQTRMPPHGRLDAIGGARRKWCQTAPRRSCKPDSPTLSPLTRSKTSCYTAANLSESGEIAASHARALAAEDREGPSPSWRRWAFPARVQEEDEL
jgi:hypothetical protein